MSVKTLKVLFNPRFQEEPDVIQQAVLGEYGGVESLDGPVAKCLLLVNWPEEKGGGLAAKIPFNMGSPPLKYYVEDVWRERNILEMTQAKIQEVQINYDNRAGHFESFA